MSDAIRRWDEFQHPVRDECLRQHGKDVLRHAKGPLELTEPLLAQERVADDEQRPPISHRLHRLDRPRHHTRVLDDAHGATPAAVEVSTGDTRQGTRARYAAYSLSGFANFAIRPFGPTAQPSPVGANRTLL